MKVSSRSEFEPAKSSIIRMPSFTLLAGVVILGFFLLALMSQNPQHPWGDDWAQYVLHAQNILTGNAYADTGYLFNPDFPNVGPPTYPPGLPLLLVPTLAAYGVNILAFKIVSLVCTVLALLVAFRLLSVVVGQDNALITILVLTLHPYVWELGQTISSEAPYLLFNLAVLWWAVRPVSRGAAAIAAGMLLGLLIFYSVSVRSIGITLLPAVIIYGWAHRKPLAWLMATAITLAVMIWLQSRFLVQPTVYENELKVPTIGLLVGNAYGYLNALSRWFPLPAGLGIVSATAVAVLAAVGAWSICMRPQAANGPAATGVRAIAARVPLVLWYLAFYLGALWVAAIVPDARYLLPVMPIIIGFAVAGAAFVFRRFSASRSITLAAVVLLAAYCAALHFRASNIDFRESSVEVATCGPCLEMFTFVRTTTPSTSVVMFVKPRAMALLGERPSWRPANRYTLEELQRNMRERRIDIVVTGAPGSKFSELFPPSEAQAQLIRGSTTQLLFRNSMFDVIQFNPVEAAH
ncbi:hypothetical protein ACFQUU_17855 [Herbaspirillum sp. GCM10030257]|uniref:hypothetical protein n=1 Tax=Herbaspirillum sp. GCM10030257 TaxID=3273393 RepID=UPI00361E0ECF